MFKRAMAVCITLMCGRLGTVAGTNIIGLLLETNCSLTFGIIIIVVIGKIKQLFIYKIYNLCIHFLQFAYS